MSNMFFTPYNFVAKRDSKKSSTLWVKTLIKFLKTGNKKAEISKGSELN